MSLAVKRSMSLLVKTFMSLANGPQAQRSPSPRAQWASSGQSRKCRLTQYMVALYTARIFEFFVKRLCSGLWSSCFSIFPTPPISYFSPFHCFISVTGAWNIMGAHGWVAGICQPCGQHFYLGAGRPQWKPLGIPGTHLPPK